VTKILHREVNLPFGNRAIFSATEESASLDVAQPINHPTSARARRKLVGAYRAARDEFLTDLAVLRGEEVSVIEAERTEQPGIYAVFPETARVFKPAVKH
jgi:hypothetical protein